MAVMVVFDVANLFAVCLYNNFNFEMFSIPNLIIIGSQHGNIVACLPFGPWDPLTL